MTWIVVQKRHHLRLFPGDQNKDRSGNTVPGEHHSGKGFVRGLSLLDLLTFFTPSFKESKALFGGHQLLTV